MSLVTDYQLRQMLKTLTGVSDVHDPNLDNINDLLSMLVNHGKLNLPCDPYKMFLIQDRIPVLREINVTRKKSILLQNLYDRYAETGLVADAFLAGKDALFIATLAQSGSIASEWLNCMGSENVQIHIKSTDEENKLVIAPLRCFVPSKGS